MSSPIVHFEFAGRDGEALEAFYSGVFGWAFERREVGDGLQYGMIMEGDAGDIGGGVRHEPDGEAEVVVYIQVDDLSAAVARAEELGGKVRIPPTPTPEVTFALVEDPEGNPVGMTQRR